MKKRGHLILVCVLALCIGYWGYKQFKNTSSLLGKVHVNANAVIKIGIHDIKETLVLDALSAPKYYYDQIQFSDSDEEKDSIGGKGIDLQPYNLLLYTLPSVENTVFGTLDIDDSQEFEQYLAKELQTAEKVLEKKDGYQYALLPKRKMALAWSTDQVVFAFSTAISASDLFPIFSDVLEQESTISDSDHPLLAAVDDGDGHIVFATENGAVDLFFEDGNATIEGQVFTEKPQQYQKEISVELEPEAALQLYYDGNFEQQDNKNTLITALGSFSFFEKNNLQISELMDRTNGFFSISVNGNTTQTDTIISYTYDDNFEKVAQKTLQTKTVPRIHMNLGAANESLLEYLEAQESLGPKQIFEPFPLYQLYAKEDAMNTSFDTFEGIAKTQEQIRTTFFDCNIDFKKLQEIVTVPQWKAFLDPLKQLRLSATQGNDNEIIINGHVTGNEPGINIISQLAFTKKTDSLPEK
ncbi:hypothetical protein [Maribacter sp. 2-571]|uniref:hypothetical protein n=1 Tax=Maribacter sp. 2-571 TaxID=3417569 RepID=UPI003D3345FE